MERLHLLRAPQLRAVLSRGYSLHLDATCEKGKGGLFICMDGIRGWVLSAQRIATESGELLAPVVERTVKLFGDPVASVRDLGNGMAAAVESLRKRGIRDLVCHYHFLRAVGSRLLKQPYGQLRDLLKSSSVRSDLVVLRRQLRPYIKGVVDDGHFGTGSVRGGLLALLHWLIEGQGGKDLAFPFDLPLLELVLRCRTATKVAANWLPRPWNELERKAMRAIECLVRRADKDPRMAPTTAELEDRWRVFSELRTVMRLDDSELPAGSHGASQLPIPAAELRRLLDIQTAVRQYKADLRLRTGDEAKKKHPAQPEAIVLKYLESYRTNLFGHPAIYDSDAHIIAVVQRTNNPPEHWFGGRKQLLRRRLGRASLAHDLQQQPAQAAFVSNLSSPEYVRLLCGSLDNMARAFASLDRADLARTSLTRDHRDSALDKLVRQLLDRNPPPEGARLPPLSSGHGTHATAL